MEAYLCREQERERVEQYERGYQQMPESEEEMALAETMAQTAFADNPWEEVGER